MKVIIQISATHQEPYNSVIQAQKDTWASVHHPNVSVAFVYAEDVGVEDEYELQHVKLKRWAKSIMNKEWDFLLLGSSSSYFDLNMVHRKALTLPKEKCYCGIKGMHGDVTFASGCGHFVSRDVVSLLIEGLTEEPHPYSDVAEGEVMVRHGIEVTPGAERFDFNHTNDNLYRTYHYRCKTNDKDRNKDIIAMHKVHTFLS